MSDLLWTARCSILEPERVNLWKNIPFGENWRCNGLPVALPHDAMLSERRTQESTGGTNTGFFVAQDYEYIKEFIASVNAAYIDFEGVY